MECYGCNIFIYLHTSTVVTNSSNPQEFTGWKSNVNSDVKQVTREPWSGPWIHEVIVMIELELFNINIICDTSVTSFQKALKLCWWSVWYLETWCKAMVCIIIPDQTFSRRMRNPLRCEDLYANSPQVRSSAGSHVYKVTWRKCGKKKVQDCIVYTVMRKNSARHLQTHHSRSFGLRADHVQSTETSRPWLS